VVLLVAPEALVPGWAVAPVRQGEVLAPEVAAPERELEAWAVLGDLAAVAPVQAVALVQAAGLVLDLGVRGAEPELVLQVAEGREDLGSDRLVLPVAKLLLPENGLLHLRC
jgi:hypothetical protein